MKTKYYITAVLASLLCSSVQNAKADEVVSCDGRCPDTTVLKSYSDGNNVNCFCALPSSMDPTVADPIHTQSEVYNNEE